MSPAAYSSASRIRIAGAQRCASAVVNQASSAISAAAMGSASLR
jgi:hypothetical protein